MTVSRFDRIATLFRQASDLPPDERRRFLDTACDGETSLRDRVLSLFEHEEHPPDLLRSGAMLEMIDALRRQPPSTIGPYTILEEIGEGGMGVVYRAQQEVPIRRQVAIKLILRSVDSQGTLERFHAERQALAAMKHQNIARIHDAGTSEEGRPYIVMELVDGEPITTHCRRRNLSIPERLAIFIQVCDGVGHAHRNGVIHRDIKPSNVLVEIVDGRPVPKIIDFGVAKTFEGLLGSAAPLTVDGQILGTPEAMSPEQCRFGAGRVDTRSDVYSLGVLLYELLTDRRPFDAGDGGLEELLRRIREEMPQRPSAVGPAERARQLRGDLDWIALKALEKDPDHRYATPTDLADDIHRHLNLEPVEAGPPRRFHQAIRFARRHRAAVSFAAAAAFVLVAATVTSLYQAGRIAREAERANAEAKESAEIVGFLLDLFGAQGRKRGLAPPERQRWYESFDELVARARAGLEGRPILRAQLLHELGELQLRSGPPRTALALFEEARLDLARTLGPDDPATLRAVDALASFHVENREYPEAERMLLDLFETRRRALGEDDAQTLASAGRLGYLYKIWPRNEDAAHWLGKASGGLARVLGESHEDTLLTRSYLAGVLLELRRYAEAKAMLDDLVVKMSGPHAVFPRGLGIVLYNLGCAHANLGASNQALDSLEKAVGLGYTPLGSVYQDPQLDPLARDARLALIDRKARLNMPQSWPDLMARARVHFERGEHASAERLLNDVLDAIRRIRGTVQHLDAMTPLLLLADVHLAEGRFAEAEAALLDRMRAVESNRQIHPSNAAATSLYLARCRFGLGDEAGGLDMLEKTLAMPALVTAAAYRPYVDAVRAAVAGDTASALGHLETAAHRGYDDAQWIRSEPAFLPMRTHPRFQAIVSQVARQAP